MKHNLLEVRLTIMYTPISATGPVYEADASVMHTIQQCRERIHHICRQHMNRRVMVHTVHGQSHEGLIVGFDDHYLYLDVSVSAGMRPPFPAPYPPFYPPYYDPFSQTILPLVLFNLLTI